MSDVSEFIAIYANNPQQSLIWLETHTVDSISWESLDQLANEYQQKKLGWKGKEDEYILAVTNSINILFQKSADSLYSLINTADDFIKLAAKFFSNLNLFLTTKPQVIHLFKTAKQFIALVGFSSSAGRKMITLNPEHIITLFHRAEEFISLGNKSRYTAEDLLKAKPEQVGKLFSNAEQFIKLTHEIQSSAKPLVKANDCSIIYLFNTACILYAHINLL